MYWYLNFLDEISLKRTDKLSVLSNFNIYYTWKNKKKQNKNNKFKISAPTLNDKLELSDRLYSVLDIQDHLNTL